MRRLPWQHGDALARLGFAGPPGQRFGPPPQAPSPPAAAAADALAAGRRHDGGAGGPGRIRQGHLQGPSGPVGRAVRLSGEGQPRDHSGRDPAPGVAATQLRGVAPQVTDAVSGLSYQRLSSPWGQGCPSDLNTPTFNWSAGENAVAGHVSIGGSFIDWHGLACSGLLQQQFAYAGPADLEPTAMSLVATLDPAYYGGVPHSRTIEDSSATQVSGHQAWIVKFLMTYSDGASQGLTWSSEPGAVVVVDLGASQMPAVFYVSVPANLGIGNLSTLIDSLHAS